MIAVLDYGIGNVGSLLAMCAKIGVPARAVQTPEGLRDADSLILPGVGHYDAGMSALRATGFEDPLREAVFGRRLPLLGICLGMQMLADSSEEGTVRGLGFVPGRVKRFAFPEDSVLKIPNMGWRDLTRVRRCALFPNPDAELRFYFVHSYHFCTDHPEDLAASAEYGGTFTAAVKRDNIWGTQFHPEKSHRYGMALLSAFAAVTAH